LETKKITNRFLNGRPFLITPNFFALLFFVKACQILKLFGFLWKFRGWSLIKMNKTWALYYCCYFEYTITNKLTYNCWVVQMTTTTNKNCGLSNWKINKWNKKSVFLCIANYRVFRICWDFLFWRKNVKIKQKRIFPSFFFNLIWIDFVCVFASLI
jgi:hypothetical protein